MDDFLTQQEYRILSDKFVRHARRIWPRYFTTKDFQDAFQEAAIIYYNNCRKQGKRLFNGIEEERWIFAIGRNILRKRYRKEKGKSVSENGQVADTDELFEGYVFDSDGDQLMDKLRKLIRGLPPVDRDIYVAVKVHRIPYKELAEEYDRSEQGLRVLVNRINNKLRKELGGRRIA